MPGTEPTSATTPTAPPPNEPRERAAPKRMPRPIGAATLAAELRVAIMRTSRRLRAEGASLDISAGQFSVLVALQAQPMTPGQLAEREQIQAPSMTRIVNSLVTAGHVSREENPQDRRQVVVAITPSGSEMVVRVRSKRTQWLAKRVAALTPQERATLHEASLILTEMSGS